MSLISVTVDYNRRALISIVSLLLLSASMGMIAVQAYAGTFFSMAAPTISPDLCSIVLALVFVVSSGLTVVVTNMVSRRVSIIKQNEGKKKRMLSIIIMKICH